MSDRWYHMLQAFRGRDPSTEALLRHSGLVAA